MLRRADVFPLELVFLCLFCVTVRVEFLEFLRFFFYMSLFKTLSIDPNKTQGIFWIHSDYFEDTSTSFYAFIMFINTLVNLVNNDLNVFCSRACVSFKTLDVFFAS